MSNRIILILSLVFIYSCEKIVFKEQENANPEDLYNQLWKELDENYVFFDLKSIDWDAVYTDHYDAMKLVETEGDLFKVLTTLMGELKDGHAGFFTRYEVWKYPEYYLGAPTNYHEKTLYSNYLNTAQNLGPFTYTILNDNVGYIRYPSFRDDFEKYELNNLIELMNQKTNGLILDLRENQGGKLDNTLALMSPFVQNNQTVGEIYRPNKQHQLEFSENLSVSPNDEIEQFKGKTVILANRKCYSACSVFIGFMKNVENITVIGDTTGGGSGIMTVSELNNGWQFRYSAAKITLPGSVDMETGVVPDEYIITGAVEEMMGIDAVVERAIEILN